MSTQQERAQFMAWLAGLKEGDEVVVPAVGIMNPPEIGKVERLTPTLIVVRVGTFEFRVRKDRGTIQGNGYRYIRPLTDEAQAQIAHHEHRRWLSGLTFGSSDRIAAIPAPVIAAMHDAYDKAMTDYQAAHEEAA